MNSKLLSDKEIICKHCGIGLKERPAWSQGSIFRWMHVDSQLINCADNLHSGSAKPLKEPKMKETFEQWYKDNHKRLTQEKLRQDKENFSNAEREVYIFSRAAWNAGRGER